MKRRINMKNFSKTLRLAGQKVPKPVARLGLKVSKYSPEILLTAGIVGVVTATVLAVKATPKAEVILDNAKEEKEKIEDVYKDAELCEEEGLTDLDHRKDIYLVKLQTAVKVGKVYLPAFSIGITSIGFILGAHCIIKKRNVALMGAYTAMEEGYNRYRDRVREELGEDADRRFKHGIKKRESQVYSGKDDKVVDKEVNTYDSSDLSEFARKFDSSCTEFCAGDTDYNKTYLMASEAYMNNLLHSRGHVFLNEVYDALGMPRTSAGQQVGWVDGSGDDYIDYGLYSPDYKGIRFVDGKEEAIMLDFNVDGIILDLI